MTETVTPADPDPQRDKTDRPGPDKTRHDPRDTDHPVGEEQAQRNINDDPAG